MDGKACKRTVAMARARVRWKGECIPPREGATGKVSCV